MITDAYSQALHKLLQGKIYKFYKATPTTVWMNNPNEETDVRVKVDLK